ncbi:MAG: hypothetical protein ACREYF_24210 [Gammaproteobacteria bacterium]
MVDATFSLLWNALGSSPIGHGHTVAGASCSFIPEVFEQHQRQDGEYDTGLILSNNRPTWLAAQGIAY